MSDTDDPKVMRIKFIFFLIIILIVCCLLLWSKKHKAPLAESHTAAITAQASQPEQAIHTTPAASANSVAPNTDNSAPIAAPQPPTLTLDESNRLQQRVLADWQGRIDFYGKVVDENSNPVVGAAVSFQWVETPSGDGNRSATTVSDHDGLFELRDQLGLALTVSVSKDGYDSSRRGQDTFNYGPLKGTPFVPDFGNPVIFKLRHKGTTEPLIHIAGIGLHKMRDYLLDANGKPTDVSLTTGNLVPPGQGDLEVAIQMGPPLNGLPSRSSWQCTITVPNGGLVQTGEEFPDLAPQTGYQTSDFLNITPTNWIQTADRHYYVHLPNGDFGQVHLRIIGASSPYFRLESYLNPSAGSQNLEPSN